MPRITTIAEARELVGRTFERNGNLRKIVRVDTVKMRIDAILSRPGVASIAMKGMRFDAVSDWLSGAKEITE